MAVWVANSVDPDETPSSAASRLGLHCLLRPVCPNTYSKWYCTHTHTHTHKNYTEDNVNSDANMIWVRHNMTRHLHFWCVCGKGGAYYDTSVTC